jgi:hypothetical protein
MRRRRLVPFPKNVVLLAVPDYKPSYDGKKRLEIKVSVLKLDEGKLRNDIDGRLDGLRVEGWAEYPWFADRDGLAWEENGLRYGERHYITEHTAGLMLDTLRRLNKKLVALRERFGYPTTFGRFIAHLADAVGATMVYFPKDARSGWAYDDHAYDRKPVGDAAAHLDYLYKKWLADCTPKPVESAPEEVPT